MMNNILAWIDGIIHNQDQSDVWEPAKDWAYTKIKEIHLDQLQQERYPHTQLPQWLDLLMQTRKDPIVPVEILHQAKQLFEPSHHLVWINGTPTQLWNGSTEVGQVRLRPFKSLPKTQQIELVQAYRRSTEDHHDLLAYLHVIVAEESYLLEIEDGVTIDPLIHIQHIITPGISHLTPRLFIKVGKGSRATIVESWDPPLGDQAILIHPLTYAKLEEGGHLTYYTLQSDNKQTQQVGHIYATQSSQSHFAHYSFAFSPALYRLNLTTSIQGTQAETNLYGFYHATSSSIIDHCIRVIHHEPHSTSTQHYKGIVGGQACSSFHGTIYLKPEAQQTQAFQTSNAIITSPEARHHAKPQLEIFADDVKCSHGATTGQLDPEQLFYLQARGIDRPLAQEILLNTFAQEVIDLVAIPSLQSYILEAFQRDALS